MIDRTEPRAGEGKFLKIVFQRLSELKQSQGRPELQAIHDRDYAICETAIRLVQEQFTPCRRAAVEKFNSCALEPGVVARIERVESTGV
jgi:hypothetical protein